MATQTTGGFWSRLSPRERIYVLALILVFFVMGTAVLFYMRSGRLRDTRKKIETYRTALAKVHTQGSIYEELLKDKKERESSIADEPILFATLLETAGRGIENLQVSQEEEQPAQDLGGGLRKRSFNFRLRAVSLDDMLKLLSAIEGQSNRIIVTEHLRILSDNPTADLLGATVTIATWERTPLEGEDDAEEGAGK